MEPSHHLSLAECLAVNDEMVRIAQARKAENRRRKAEGLPRLKLSPLEKEMDRQRRLRFREAAKHIALRGWTPPPPEEIIRLVAERARNGWSERYGLPDANPELDRNEMLWINNGIGQDSVAMDILYVFGLMPPWMYRHRVYFAFADTLAEKPETYAYAEQVLIPFLRRFGHELLWLKPGPDAPFHVTKNRVLGGLRETYMSDLHPSFPMWNSRARCTTNHKQAVLARCREHYRKEWNGMTAQQMTRNGYRDWVLVGIAAEEANRLEPTYQFNYHCVYPLYALGLDRTACQEIIRAAGLPVPPKSGCTCCYAAPIWERWWLSQKHPDVFALDVAMEQAQIEDRLNRGLKPNYMCMEYDCPLPEAVERWHAENPTVTVEQVEEWLITRHYSRDDKPRRKEACHYQMFFDFDTADAAEDEDDEFNDEADGAAD